MSNAMKNPTKNKEEISTKDTKEAGLSIYEIKTIYNKLNHNLIEVMERIEDILSRSWFDENDKKYINKRDCKFQRYTLKKDELEEHGLDLMSNIFEATLTDALHKYIDFFKGTDYADWYANLLEYRTEILKLNGDSTYLLGVLNKLFDSLHEIYKGFHPEIIEEIGQIYNDNDFSFDFDFMFVYNQLTTKSDLIAKNNFLLDAIAEKDMICLLMGVDPKKHEPNIQFKEKCKQAIEIIKFQLDNTLEQNFHKNSTSATTALETVNSTTENEILIKNPEFTTRRQVLAFYYLLNEVDKNTNSIDRTVKARFIHFLTGKNESNIYKTLSEPHKGLENDKNKKSALRDLEYIKQHFDELGLKSISHKISNDVADS